jgi:hypothetical protein
MVVNLLIDGTRVTGVLRPCTRPADQAQFSRSAASRNSLW